VGEKPYSSGGDCEDTEGRGREAGRERESERVRGGMQIHVSIYRLHIHVSIYRLHIYIFYCGLYPAVSSLSYWSWFGFCVMLCTRFLQS